MNHNSMYYFQFSLLVLSISILHLHQPIKLNILKLGASTLTIIWSLVLLNSIRIVESSNSTLLRNESNYSSVRVNLKNKLIYFILLYYLFLTVFEAKLQTYLYNVILTPADSIQQIQQNLYPLPDDVINIMLSHASELCFVLCCISLLLK